MNSKLSFMFAGLAIILASLVPTCTAFAPRLVAAHVQRRSLVVSQAVRKIKDNEVPNNKITAARRNKLGIADDEDEYDLGVALENSTDPFISKVIAGSLILAIVGLLVVGVVIPATTDYGEGICNTILTGGRC